MSATKTVEKIKGSKAESPEAEFTAEEKHRSTSSPQATEEVVVVKRTREFGDYLGSTRKALKSTPLAFAVTAILGIAAGFALASWQLERSVSLSGTVEPLSSASEYSALSNRDLRMRTINLTGQLRGFLIEWAIAESQIDVVQEVQAASSALQQQLVWEEYVASSSSVSQQWANEFASKFGSEATHLRAELVSRLGESENDDRTAALYATASNPVDVRHIIEELDRLAEGLLVQ